MFFLSIIIAIIIGYLCKGQLRNLMFAHLSGVSFIFFSFTVECVTKMLLKRGIIELGVLSYSLHLITYILLFIMIFRNWRKNAVKLMGLGSLLNALVIFSNGGIMPVGRWAMNRLGVPVTAGIEGMYLVMNDRMYFRFLGDIFPIYLKKIAFIISIGDLFIILGIMMFIVQSMKLQSEMGSIKEAAGAF